MNVKHKVQKDESRSGILPLSKRLEGISREMNNAAARANEVHHKTPQLSTFNFQLTKRGKKCKVRRY